MAANNHRLLIKNGHIYDPGHHIDYFGDLYMFKDRIVETMPDDGTNVMIIDAEGALVVPGLIDFHAHVGYGTSEAAFDADPICLPNGVTTVVDAGTRGIANMDQFVKDVIPSAISTIRCLCNVSPVGITSMKFPEDINPRYFDEAQIQFLMEKYPGMIKGLKLRISRTILKEYDISGLEPLKKAVELAENLGVFLAVHITDPPCEYSEILKYLRPGDVWVHPYQGMGRTIIDENGKLVKGVMEAKERGVILDLAAARTNQNYVVAKKAIEQGLAPDIYSTDMSRDSAYMHPVFSLLYVLSTYRALGISMEDLLKGCTSIPAKKLGMENEIGSLLPGAKADVAIIRENTNEREYIDWFDNRITGRCLLEPRATIKDGRLVYLAMDAKQEVKHRLELV